MCDTSESNYFPSWPLQFEIVDNFCDLLCAPAIPTFATSFRWEKSIFYGKDVIHVFLYNFKFQPNGFFIHANDSFIWDFFFANRYHKWCQPLVSSRPNAFKLRVNRQLATISIGLEPGSISVLCRVPYFLVDVFDGFDIGYKPFIGVVDIKFRFPSSSRKFGCNREFFQTTHNCLDEIVILKRGYHHIGLFVLGKQLPFRFTARAKQLWMFRFKRI